MKLITSLKRSGIVINKKKKIEISKIGGGNEDKKKKNEETMGLFDRTMQWTIHWMKSTKFPFAKRKRKIPVVRRTCYVNSLYGRFNIPLSRSHVKSTVCVCVCVCICVCVCMCVHWTTISLCNTALYKCVRPGFPFRSAFMFADQPEKIVFLCQECPTEDFKPLWHGNTVHLIYLSVCDDCDPDHARYTSQSILFFSHCRAHRENRRIGENISIIAFKMLKFFEDIRSIR